MLHCFAPQTPPAGQARRTEVFLPPLLLAFALLFLAPAATWGAPKDDIAAAEALQRKGGIPQAMDLLRAVAGTPSNPPEDRTRAYTLMASLSPVPPEALGYADMALRLTPDHPPALYQKSVALYRMRQYDDALEILQKILQTAPTPEAWSMSGLIWRQKGDYPKALEYCSKAVGMQPQRAVFRLRLARVHLLCGAHREAVGEYRKALQSPLQPAVQAEGLYHLGNALLALGEKKQAAECFKKALPHLKDKTMEKDMREKMSRLAAETPLPRTGAKKGPAAGHAPQHTQP